MKKNFLNFNTKYSIFNAFTALLSEKDFNQITVGEIIDGADVGRATFYAHFETKDFLLKELGRMAFGRMGFGLDMGYGKMEYGKMEILMNERWRSDIHSAVFIL